MMRSIARALPGWLRAPALRAYMRYADVYAVKCYSQEGEDLILRRLFADRDTGFYVDVGAHHPRRFSNTHIFYSRGWRGINVEPNPDAMQAFRSERARDINVQCGVGVQEGRLTYYKFDEPALNTFDAKVVESRLAETSYRLAGKIEVPVRRLESILAEHLPAGQRIDFLTVDVEGFDLDVLRSNDWTRFRPACVLVESLGTTLEDALRGEVYALLKRHGYGLFAKTFNTLIFRDGASA